MGVHSEKGGMVVTHLYELHIEEICGLIKMNDSTLLDAKFDGFQDEISLDIKNLGQNKVSNQSVPPISVKSCENSVKILKTFSSQGPLRGKWKCFQPKSGKTISGIREILQKYVEGPKFRPPSSQGNFR